MSEPLFQKNPFILRMPGLANFADIIKIAVMLITTTFKNPINVKRIRKNAISLCFLI